MNDTRDGSTDGARTDEADEAPWYEKAFEAGYLTVYAHRNDADAARALEFLTKSAGIGGSMRLLDLCCGAGRHLARVAPHVAEVWGLDLSGALLGEARLALDEVCAEVTAQRSGGACPRLVQGDMRHLPFAGGSFDAVINMFTSFGYFDDDAENDRVLAEVARILRPGGLFVLDHINRAYLEANLQPQSRRKLPGGVELIERRELVEAGRRVRKQVEWIEADRGRFDWIESVRVYRPGEIEACMAIFGLEVQSWHGDFDGRPLGPETPRMIAVGRRAE